MGGSPLKPDLEGGCWGGLSCLGNPAPSTAFPIAIGPNTSPLHLCAEFSQALRSWRGLGWWFEWAQPLMFVNEGGSLIRCLVYHCLGSLLPDALVLPIPRMQLVVPVMSDARCAGRRPKSLSFLSPPRLSKASTSGTSAVSAFLCSTSALLWDPRGSWRGWRSPSPRGAPCACSWLGTSASSRDPKPQKSLVPIASGPVQL